MSDRLPKHLHDALAAATHAMAFVQGLDAAAFSKNLLVRSAVERQLEILGEACRRALDDEPALRDRVPDTLLAIALRNRHIHGYDRLEHAIVFDTMVRDLLGLRAALTSELGRQPAC